MLSEASLSQRKRLSPHCAKRTICLANRVQVSVVTLKAPLSQSDMPTNNEESHG
jgi:hypothetical protein